MSKSLGNVLDPLDLIAEYGADALRFTLLTGGTPGNDMKLSVTRIEANRNFANKIWNAARFVIMNLGDAALPMTDEAESLRADLRAARRVRAVAGRSLDPEPPGPYAAGSHAADRQLATGRGRTPALRIPLERILRLVHRSLQGAALRRRSAKRPRRLARSWPMCLEQSLRLLHPYMPFVTETIWQNLPGLAEEADALIVARWPKNAGRIDDERRSGVRSHPGDRARHPQRTQRVRCGAGSSHRGPLQRRRSGRSARAESRAAGNAGPPRRRPG